MCFLCQCPGQEGSLLLPTGEGAYLSVLQIFQVQRDECFVHYVPVVVADVFPQAGVALGMAIKAHELGTEGAVVANITLFAVLIYELVGPFLTKIALLKAGEINPEEKVSARGENVKA